MKPLKPWTAGAFALAATVGTLEVRMALAAQLGSEPKLVIFTVPIMLSAYVGGLRAGLLATGLAYLLASYNLLPPTHSFWVKTGNQQWNVFFLMLAGVMISALAEALHRAHRRADFAVREQQTRVALAKTEVLQSAIFNSATFSCIATDAKGVIQLFNVGAEHMLGYSAAEVLNRITPAELSDPQEVIARAQALSVELGIPIAPGFEALVFKASRGIEDVYELTKIRKDGSRFPAAVSVTSLRDPAGEIIGYLLIGTDISARKRAEAALSDSEAGLRDAQRIAQIGSWSWDAVTGISNLSPELRRLFNFDPSKAIPGFPEQRGAFYPVAAWELVNTARRHAMSTGEGYNLTLEAHKSDGQPLWITSRGEVVRNAGRQITGMRGTIQDVTAAHEAAAAVERARLMAEKASRAKSDFLSSMSHELRTPLNGIIGFTEFLMDEKPGPLRPKQKEYLGDVLNSGRHLLQLINDVLDLSKVEAGKMELHPETFAVRKAVEEVAAVIQGIAQKKHISVGIEIGPGLDAVVLDQHKFKQMLYNLLSNAVKFSDDDGQVEIRARSVDPSWFEVSVSDTGIGIKAEDLGRLFSEFEQLDSGTARRFEGTGLGLALTKKIVEFQGGRVSVESEPAKGSVFTVALPMTSVQMSAA